MGLEAVAYKRFVRISPKKLRRLIEPLRGKTLSEVRAILDYAISKNAIPVLKVINSAAANLQQKKGAEEIDPDKVYVFVKVDKGPIWKRIMPHAHGRAWIKHRRFSHIMAKVYEAD